MDNKKEKIALNDELLDRITGGGTDVKKDPWFGENEFGVIECPPSPDGNHHFDSKVSSNPDCYICTYCGAHRSF